jgi:hypothetical protein
MKACVWLILLLTLGACGSKLRTSVCHDKFEKPPKSYWGEYEVVIPSPAAELSSALTLRLTLLKVSATGISISQTPSSVISHGDFKGGACWVGGRYIIETLNQDRTYSLSELLPFGDGLVSSTLTVDLEAVLEKGYPVHFLPQVDSMVVGGTISFPATGVFSTFGPIAILDNSRLSAEEVVDVSRRISMQIILNRVTKAQTFAPSGHIRFRTDGWRLQ